MRLDTVLSFDPQRNASAGGHVQTWHRAGLTAVVLGLTLCMQGCESSHSPMPNQAEAAAISPTGSTGAPEVDGNATALAAANRAFHENRVVAPAGDNALEHTLRALKGDTHHAGAVEMLVDITPIAAAAIEVEIAAENFVEAERVLRLLAAANPDSLTVIGLQRRFDLASRKRVAEPVAPSASPSVAAAPNVDTVAEDVATRKQDLVETESESGHVAAAAPSRSRSETSIATATEQESDDDNATIVPLPAKATAVISEPIPTFRAKPVYPSAARKRRAEGWVELQFTVGVDGVARQVEVLQSEPPGVFDRSALQALARWKFKPAVRDGHPIEARAKTKMGFKIG